MEQSKVYFTSFKATEHENLLQKLHRLMKTAGFETIDFTDKYTAIKIHFGEYGNLAFLRPNYARVVADYVKELGGKPYLTDCNTLYVGSRKNALDHLETAYVNGFSPYQTGCHVIIGDGLKGTDETLVPIDGEYVKEAKIGHAIMDADVFISLTHFKGHEMAGFGGALKISVWAAVPGRVRWSSTVTASRRWTSPSVWDAARATGYVPTARPLSRMARRISTMTNAWGADVVWRSVRKMRFPQALRIPSPC